MTEKRCGRVKGRTVADGRSESGYTNKDDSVSPAVSVEGFFVLLAVNAKETIEICAFMEAADESKKNKGQAVNMAAMFERIK